MVYVPGRFAVVQPGAFGGFDDAERQGNLGIPSGSLMARYVSALNSIASSGRIIRTFWGGDDTRDANALRRFLWDHQHQAATRLRFVLIVVRPNGAQVDGQAIRISGIDSGGHIFPDNPIVEKTLYNLINTTERFLDSTGSEVMSFEVTPDDVNQRLFEVTIGSLTTNGVQILAGIVYECAESSQDASLMGYTPHDHIAPGRDIVTEGIGSSTSMLDTFRSNFNHTVNRKRPMIGWDAIDPGNGYVNFNTSTQAYRYIHDQSVGTGGTSPASTGPAITFPLYKAATGISTTVRVAVRVYAAMSGATDNGSVGVSHQDGAGGMTSFANLITTISGTSWAWYPALSTSAMYFDGRADLAYERIVLAGKSNGTTNTLRIGAYSIGVLPALNVT
jgi:hypothetical protein